MTCKEKRRNGDDNFVVLIDDRSCFGNANFNYWKQQTLGLKQCLVEKKEKEKELVSCFTPILWEYFKSCSLQVMEWDILESYENYQKINFVIM